MLKKLDINLGAYGNLLSVIFLLSLLASVTPIIKSEKLNNVGKFMLISGYAFCMFFIIFFGGWALLMTISPHSY